MNYLAVLAAAIVAFAVGSAWYSPLLFGGLWRKLRGVDPSSMQGMKPPVREMILEFIATLVTAYVLALFSLALGANTASSALELAVYIWVGFYVTLLLGETLWEKKPFQLFLINAGLRLVNLCLMALIVSLW